jgi:transcription-repair coupling factor (superfamily II helicase)
MDIKDLQELYRHSQQVTGLIKTLENKTINTVFLKGVVASAMPIIVSSLNKYKDYDFLLIMPDEDEAGYTYNDLCRIMGEESVLFFPSSYKRAVKYGQHDAANEILRTQTLAKLTSANSGNDAGDDKFIIVSYPAAIAELVVSKKQIDSKLITLEVGQSVDIVELEKQLLAFGFSKTDYVYEPGQFAVRGSLLDVYSYSSELPFRIDFFGDDIDTIRTFEVEDQLSKDKVRSVRILPALASLSEEKIPLTSFLPDKTIVLSKDLLFIRDRVAQIYDEGFLSQALSERLEGATETEQQQIMQQMRKETTLCPASKFVKDVSAFVRIEYGQQVTGSPQAILNFDITPQPLFHKNFELLSQTLNDYSAKGYKTYILSDSEKQQERLKEILVGKSMSLPLPVKGVLHEGFIDNNLKLCFFTDHQIFDRFHKYSLKSDRARMGKMALTLKELQELEPGDFLVHVDFGIGKFGGLVRKPTEKGYIEEIRIIYQRGDIVDVSIHSLYKISKYRRQDSGEPPRLSTLGTGAWERLKEKTKTKIKDIARDLIKLYAKRRHEKGFAFSADTYLQQELEASFLYEDTPDQIKTTQDVKRDMESARPMDRLVCGDVGFGKTEIAVRAAFKAAYDSKQVAVLVPTTVLAFQHYQTFSSRLQSLPVRVEYLSRARSANKTKEILADLEAGKIDIIIGTHKLISKTVKWKDLGLLIIDEEQKFGVSVKEKLRKLKTNVDTLTMTATPIPRTLQFSLMGARDMSIMRTPPPNRYPIQTILATYGHETVCDAINFEMSRNGQVFFVSNRISNLPEIAEMIQRYIPDCRVAIGHGQMKPKELEKIILGFINYDYDVLLSTTIVENGVDISNANTIIISDAHHFGLSDLHQIRGRVGRSNRKAFCYLLSPPLSVLTPEARRRLEALETFSDLGSGFALAMQDLDIRGAGNILGAEQSGFMEDLGYETYQKILNQAVTELKNDEFQDMYTDELAEGNDIKAEEFVDDCAIECDLEMYFPDSYVPGSSERMLLYRELDSIQTDEELEAYRKRLIDRFGAVPHEGEELMHVVLLRRLGRSLGCEKIMLKQGLLNMQFVSNKESAYYRSQTFGKVLNFIAANARRCDLKEVKGRRLLRVNNVGTVKEAVTILREMKK